MFSTNILAHESAVPAARHPGRLTRMAAALAVAASAALALCLPASAEEATGIDLWNNGGCFGCHGDLAAGGGDPANPGGPSLRRRLDSDRLVNAIACGRSGAAMPAFLKNAHEAEICGGAAGAQPDINIIYMDAYTAEEIDILVTWLEENVVGKSRITRENCAIFFGGNPNAPTCLQF